MENSMEIFKFDIQILNNCSLDQLSDEISMKRNLSSLSLDFGYRFVEETVLMNICKSFTELPLLRELSLNMNLCNGNHARRISDTLTQLNQLKRLDLNLKFDTKIELSVFWSGAFTGLKQLESLKLNLSLLYKYQFENFAKEIRLLPRLNYLSISVNSVAGNDMQYFYKCLPESNEILSLQLTLSMYKYNSSEMEKVTKEITKAAQLRELELMIVQSTRDQEYDVNFNFFQLLSKCLSCLVNLTRFSLSQDFMSKKQFALIKQELDQLPYFNSFSFEGKMISLKQIGQQLSEMNSLNRLSLNQTELYNQQKTQAILNSLNMMKHFKNLEYLKFTIPSKQNVQDKFLLSIYENTREIKNLRYLEISSWTFAVSNHKKLSLFSQLTNINTLNLQFQQIIGDQNIICQIRNKFIRKIKRLVSLSHFHI